MSQTHEWMFYELMWRARGASEPYPLPWWVQQYFRHWTESYDSGLFDSKEAAFASNAHYRYWNMVGVKDHHQESLIGQAGEVEPVYDQYALSFFLFDPDRRKLHLPQHPDPTDGSSPLTQQREAGYLPVFLTRFRTSLGIDLEQKVLATTLGQRQRSLVLMRLQAHATAATQNAWLCIAVTPFGPSGFERHDKAGRYSADKRMTYLRYLPAEQRFQINNRIGPVLDSPPTHFGVYGNEQAIRDPEHYLRTSPFRDLGLHGTLNGNEDSFDHLAGLTSAVLAWPLTLTAGETFRVDIKLPVDDFRGAADISEIRSASADELELGNQSFWTGKLDHSGLQPILPIQVSHLSDLFKICRSTLLILADEGQIHPGPTIYDSFWVRDSSIEGIACALSGDRSLPIEQFGRHYPSVFNRDQGRVGPAELYGFFGDDHEKNDHEWDSNGQALWGIGRLDRILGAASNFGAGLFAPYVLDGARWIRYNRSRFGLLHSGWSAEHIGEKDKPHYWDDFWALAGLWESARLAERLNSGSAAEIWAIYEDLKNATASSIRWVLNEQRQRGEWQTFIPTGPGDVGRLDSTMIGALAYFHPCRLYMGNKLGADIDHAARMSLETIWSHFIDGGFRHDSAWNCYGPYLTLQLAHSFLFIGDLERMDRCLGWSVGNAGFSSINRGGGDDRWDVVQGAWNEQHCYPIAKDFAEFPNRWWYMGDIPHGWAAAELLLLLRDILFFEADEDSNPHIYIAPGVMPHWLAPEETIGVNRAPTVFGGEFGYRLSLHAHEQRVEIEIDTAPPGSPDYVYPCHFGDRVLEAVCDAGPAVFKGQEVRLPAGTRQASVRFA